MYHLLKLRHKVKSISTAFYAGWIASSCPDCVIDNEIEEIRACPAHEAKIAHLAALNEAANS